MGFAILQLYQKSHEISSWCDESFNFSERSTNENVYHKALEETIKHRLKEGVYW